MSPERRAARNEYMRNYHKANKEACRKVGRRSSWKYSWGMNAEEYTAFVSKPCEVCGTTDRRLGVDHDHATLTIRGALCHNCNVAIGLAKENPQILRAAAEYLEKCKASNTYARFVGKRCKA